jgi:hypothetical protein
VAAQAAVIAQEAAIARLRQELQAYCLRDGAVGADGV